MYKIGKKISPKTSKKKYLAEIIAIMFSIVIILFVVYWFFIKKHDSPTFINNSTPLVSTVKSDDTSTPIDEPTFSMVLPGTWKEISRDNDPHYHTIQWSEKLKGGIGRWFKVYVDTIPTDFPVNYVLPVYASGNKLDVGGMSDLCTHFTPGATKIETHDVSVPIDQAVLKSTFDNVNFMCDNSHVTHQVVGTSTEKALNSVTVAGTKMGAHKYFFVYDDAAYHPDYNTLTNILDSFKAK